MDFDVIIIGGSYAGLSAALTLGRAKRKVLIIDAGKPCNRQTPHSHNFLTHDGDTPAEISEKAKAEVLKYPTIEFLTDVVVKTARVNDQFNVLTESGKDFTARRLLITTGLKDTLPAIKGLAECWAISVIHCPYCHGYEVSGEKVGLLMNGEPAFEMAQNLYHWNKDLTVLTNGKSLLTEEQEMILKSRGIKIIEEELAEFKHHNGYIDEVVFTSGKALSFKAVYTRGEVSQYLDFDKQLGIELTELSTIKVDGQQQTTVKGIYAAGDCTTLMRTLSIITASGTLAAVMLNKEMIAEEF